MKLPILTTEQLRTAMENGGYRWSAKRMTSANWLAESPYADHYMVHFGTDNPAYPPEPFVVYVNPDSMEVSACAEGDEYESKRVGHMVTAGFKDLNPVPVEVDDVRNHL